MTPESAKRHPLWPAFADWLRGARVSGGPPVIGIDYPPAWWDYWRAFLAGATAASAGADRLRAELEKVRTDVLTGGPEL